MRNLYRRYRPLKLADVVGQDQVVKPLTNALKQGKINHAYLFTGPRGTGKTSVARIFAHEVNGFEYQLEDDYVDIVEIDGASNRGVDNIREIREKVMIAPTLGKYKVYIIDEVHMLTKEAFNALLKTLEEPPEHVIFIMATTDAFKVPVTITSRAENYTFKLADPGVILKHLESIVEKEKIKIEKPALEVVVRRGGGSFRDTLSLLDQISTLSDQEITKEMVEKAMGLPEDTVVSELIQSYATSDAEKISALLKDLYRSGVKPEVIAEEIITKIIENPAAETLPLLSSLPEVKAPFPEAKLLYALLKGQDLPPRMPAPQMASRPVSQPASNPVPQTPVSNVAPQPTESGSFDWSNFVERVGAANDATASQLKNCAWKLENGKLIISPRGYAKIILSKPGNLKILRETAGMEVELGGAESPKNDALTDKISGIMGGEVKEYAGGNPF